MQASVLKTKVLLCREIEVKDDLNYLQGFSAQLGFVSFVKKKTKKRQGQNALAPFQLVELLCKPSGQAFKIEEFEIQFSFRFLMESIEAQALLRILIDFSKDLSMEQEEKKSLYEVLVYAFYALEEQGTKKLPLPKEFFLKILVLAEVKLLFSFHYIQHLEEEPLKEYRFQPRMKELLTYIQKEKVARLFLLDLQTQEIHQLLNLVSKYFRMLFFKDYHQFSFFDALFSFESLLPQPRLREKKEI